MLQLAQLWQPCPHLQRSVSKNAKKIALDGRPTLPFMAGHGQARTKHHLVQKEC
jgi:hypothetical protein